MKDLYPIQVLHQGYLQESISKHNHALDGSATGTGKTLVATQLAADLQKPVIVVGLKSSLTMWREELKERGVTPLAVINFEKLRQGKSKLGHWADKKVWEWTLPKDALVIWDEVQRCQGLHSLNSAMLIAAKPYTNLMLSATAAKDPTEMRGLGFILDIHKIRDFWRWCRSMKCVPNKWGGLDFEGGTEMIDRIHRYIFPGHGHRMTIEDLKDHFQETQIISTPLDFGSEIKKIYAEMEIELAKLEAARKKDSRNPNSLYLTTQLRARQRVELCKVPAIIEMTNDLLAEGRSVAIFLNFTASIEALNNRFPCLVSIVQGGQKESVRDAQIAAFQNDKARVIIANTQAGGVSVSLHDLHGKHPRTSIISPSWREKEIIQCVGRIHRAGGKTPSQQHILFAADTVEEKVQASVQKKILHLQVFNDGVKKDEEKDEIKVAEKPEICDNEITVKEEPTIEVGDKINLLGKDVVCIGKGTSGEPTDFVATVEAEEEHAEYNPSSMSMFEKCPGFRNRKNTNEASERGVRIHKALQKEKLNELEDEDERKLGQKIQDFVDGIIAENRPALPERHREIRLDIDLGGGITTFGTADLLLIYGRRAVFCDYKTGELEVSDAETNPQGWCYTIGAFQKYPQLDEITFWFLVPRRDEAFYHTFKRSDLPEMKLRLNTIVRRAMLADPTAFNPQPELCEYCNHQATCPAIAGKALAVASKLVDGLPIPSSVTVDPTKPDDIPHLLRLAPLMEAWAQGVREAALKANLEDGIDIPGFARVERSLPRGVTSVRGTWRVIKDRGISLDDFLAACGKVSVPELEKLIMATAARGKKGETWQEVEDELKGEDLMRVEGKTFYLREQKK